MFKYGDLVQVKSGFYEGCKGYIVGRTFYDVRVYDYKIEIIIKLGNRFRQSEIEVSETDLELIKKRSIK